MGRLFTSSPIARSAAETRRMVCNGNIVVDGLGNAARQNPFGGARPVQPPAGVHGAVSTTHEHIAEAFFLQNVRQTGVIVRSQRIAGGTDHSARRIFEPLQLFLRKAVQPAEIPAQQAADAAHAAEDAADFFRVFLGFPDDAIGGGVQHAGGAASVDDQQSVEHGFSPVFDGIGERLKIVSRGRVWTSPLSLL